jgi:hypothetical protein
MFVSFSAGNLFLNANYYLDAVRVMTSVTIRLPSLVQKWVYLWLEIFKLQTSKIKHILTVLCNAKYPPPKKKDRDSQKSPP